MVPQDLIYKTHVPAPERKALNTLVNTNAPIAHKNDVLPPRSTVT
jgi:hypothetical protein